MDKKNYYKKLAELIDPPTDRNDIITKRFGAPMKRMTYRENCIDYVKKTMPCVGYRDYVVAELEKLEQIEQVVDAWNNDASHSFEDMCKINEVIKQK